MSLYFYGDRKMIMALAILDKVNVVNVSKAQFADFFFENSSTHLLPNWGGTTNNERTLNIIARVQIATNFTNWINSFAIDYPVSPHLDCRIKTYRKSLNV